MFFCLKFSLDLVLQLLELHHLKYFYYSGKRLVYVKVVAVICDGASANLTLICIHFPMTKDDEINPDTDVIYQPVNLFTSDKRFTYFVSDAPQFWNTPYMSILWNHISDIFYEFRKCSLHILPKLSNEYIRPLSYSKMNLWLAAQVLISNVSKVLLQYGLPEAGKTARIHSTIVCFMTLWILEIPSPMNLKENKY